jgi:hypothetical protein
VRREAPPSGSEVEHYLFDPDPIASHQKACDGIVE